MRVPTAERSGPTMSPCTTDGVTVTALLVLKKQRALQLKRSTSLDKLRLRRSSAPGLHMRRPRAGQPGVSQQAESEIG